MARKRSFVKEAPTSVRFTREQLAKVAQAAVRRTEHKGEIVTPAEIIREGAVRLAESILETAA